MHIIRIARLARLIVDREIAHIHTCRGARYALHRCAGVLHGLENHFKQLALLRIHIRCFEIVDSEKTVVELPDIFVDEITAVDIDATAPIAALWVVVGFIVVTVQRNRPLGCLLVDKKLPEFGRRVNISGKATSYKIVRGALFSTGPDKVAERELSSAKRYDMPYPFPQYMVDHPSRMPYSYRLRHRVVSDFHSQTPRLKSHY